MAEHTPTPWHIEPSATSGWIICDHANGWTICGRPEWPNRSTMSEANAEFICRAVNAHDALVEALADLALACKTSGVFSDTPLAGEVEADYWHAARAALAKARGEDG